MNPNRSFCLILSFLILKGLEARSVQAESWSAPPFPEALLMVDTPLDSNSASHQDCQLLAFGDCSLRGAISRANANPGMVYHIFLPPGTYQLSLVGDEDDNKTGYLDVRGNVMISGKSSSEVVITGDSQERVLQFFPGSNSELKNLTITGGQAAPEKSGGGIYNAGSLSLMSVSLTGNRAGDGLKVKVGELQGGSGGSGGGIENDGNLILSNCTISGNQAGKGGETWSDDFPQQTGGLGGSGGGIFNRGDLEISDSIIIQNQAGAGGVGKSVYCPPEFCGYGEYGYYAGHGGDGGDGGGIFNENHLLIVNSQVSNNQAGSGGVGGAGWVQGGSGGKGGNGGGIISYGSLYAENTFIENNASGWGGSSGEGWYTGFPDARGPGHGGGMFITGRAELVGSQVSANMTGPEVHFNKYHLAQGGGIYIDALANLSLRETWVVGNQASGDGGGIFNQAGLSLIGGAVDGNLARGRGGGIYNGGALQGSAFSLSSNSSGPGYDGFQAILKYSEPPLDGGTPAGGGLFNAGQAWLAAVHIDQNVAGDGGKGGDEIMIPRYSGGDGGHGGFGGIFNTGNLEIYLSTLRNNHTGQGGLGGSSELQPGSNGNGGPGGGLFNAGELHAAFLTIQGNTTGPGATEDEPGGPGGGLISTGLLSLHGSKVNGNQTTSGGVGGGIAIIGCYSSTREALIANTDIQDNMASAHGGGLYLCACNAHLDNLVIAGNQIDAVNLGSGMFQANGNAYLRHLTSANNSGGDGSGIYTLSGTAVFTNTILAGQAVGIYLGPSAQAQLQTTLWGADAWANGLDYSGPGILDIGSQNTYGDPLFMDPKSGDYHIEANSPAVDAAWLTGLNVDLDNQPRPDPATNLPDIGSDEIWPVVPLSSLSLIFPQVVDAKIPVGFKVEILPPEVSPNVFYVWSPPPLSGQGTPKTLYQFEQGGEQVVTVWAVQNGQSMSTAATFHIQEKIGFIALPVVIR